MRKRTIIKEMTKGEIRDRAIKILKLYGIHCWKQNNIAVRGRKFIGEPGLPDILGFAEIPKPGLIPGTFVVVEVKTIGDRISDDQETFMTKVVKAGGHAFIAKQSEAGPVELVKFEINSKI